MAADAEALHIYAKIEVGDQKPPCKTLQFVAFPVRVDAAALPFLAGAFFSKFQNAPKGTGDILRVVK